MPGKWGDLGRCSGASPVTGEDFGSVALAGARFPDFLSVGDLFCASFVPGLGVSLGSKSIVIHCQRTPTSALF
ncbi:hypothetical protein NtRootD5_41680 (plasmid) [Arthrobacter sp. NtRootD5]|nr:hypothetical protein NtRootA2_42410 [Arthrobacter sp. NtRootA2]BCW29626.1 hypothetical protein NtRootC45_42260 [Arthrobacter sp. NtRootC45]BCW33837.1 hypothetical protein NtRootD5_41680 [Arthrobacter sp. NtRootD5]